MILTLLLCTTEFTPDLVLQAMESIQIADLTAWSKEVFGQSMLSKRKVAFSRNKLHKSCMNLLAIAFDKINTLPDGYLSVWKTS